MRAFVSLLVAVAISFTASALAARPFSLSIKVSNSKVLYRHDVTLSGRLTSGVAGRQVSVYARPIGQLSMRKLATVASGRNGGWALRVEPVIATSYEARAGSFVTPVLSVDVKPTVATRLLRNGTIWAHVAAGRSFAGRPLELQRRSGSGWLTVERAVLNRHSDAVFAAPSSRGRLSVRVAMSVNAAGRGFLGAASDPFVYRPRAEYVSVSAPALSVTFGRRLALSGRISDGRAGQAVTILARRYGASAAVPIATLITRAGGRWVTSVAPAIETSYDARWDGIVSRVLVLGVRPAISVGQLRDQRIEARVVPAGAFVGRHIELQNRVGARWKTIDQLALTRPDGRALFPPLTSSDLTLRVAMSVNEAGAGYLGASSAPFAFHGRFVSLSASITKVLYGHALSLSGRISTGTSGASITILARPYGDPTATEGAVVVTGPGGRWSFRAAPALETSYLARWGTIESLPATVGVEPRVTVELLRKGRIAARVAASRPLAGRLVELQKLSSANHWATVMRMPLDRRSIAVFPSIATGAVAATLRIAMSVNQAGAGLLGAISQPFIYRYHRSL